MKYIAWNVYLHSQLIDTVFYTEGLTWREVRTSLIMHDGYNPNIIVRKAKPIPPAPSCPSRSIRKRY